MDSTIIVALISGGITVFNILYTNHARKSAAKSKEDKALEDGLQCLLRAEIIRTHDKYTSRGYCPIYAKESLRRAYKAYHNLGGNDIATALYNACMLLPESLREENDNED